MTDADAETDAEAGRLTKRAKANASIDRMRQTVAGFDDARARHGKPASALDPMADPMAAAFRDVVENLRGLLDMWDLAEKLPPADREHVRDGFAELLAREGFNTSLHSFVQMFVHHHR